MVSHLHKVFSNPSLVSHVKLTAVSPKAPNM